MTPEDVALFLVDPRYAATLGIMAPRCTRCGGSITRPPTAWDGREALVHEIRLACEWEKERQQEVAVGAMRGRSGSMDGWTGEVTP